MFKRLGLLGLLASTVISVHSAHAQGISQKTAVCSPAYTGRCLTPNADGSLTITGLPDYATDTTLNAFLDEIRTPASSQPPIVPVDPANTDLVPVSFSATTASTVTILAGIATEVITLHYLSCTLIPTAATTVVVTLKSATTAKRTFEYQAGPLEWVYMPYAHAQTAAGEALNITFSQDGRYNCFAMVHHQVPAS